MSADEPSAWDEDETLAVRCAILPAKNHDQANVLCNFRCTIYGWLVFAAANVFAGLHLGAPAAPQTTKP